MKILVTVKKTLWVWNAQVDFDCFCMTKSWSWVKPQEMNDSSCDFGHSGRKCFWWFPFHLLTVFLKSLYIDNPNQPHQTLRIWI